MRDSPSLDPRPVVVACTACEQRWLVAGVEEGETHTCKSCGHSFVAEPVDVPAGAAPAPLRLRTA
jgi:hypothetical protein